MSRGRRTAPLSTVHAQRIEARGGLEDYPTPPWATRALFAYGPPELRNGGLTGKVVWEPFAGRRTMSRVLADQSPARLIETDIHDYGCPQVEVMDFTSATADGVDWIISNPPFEGADHMWHRAWRQAHVGVAFLLRSAWRHGVGRFGGIFQSGQLTSVHEFVERVPINRGNVSGDNSTTAEYSWFVGVKARARFDGYEGRWIPPCRKALELDGDYDGFPNMYRVERDKETKTERLIVLTDGDGRWVEGGNDVPFLVDPAAQGNLLEAIG